MPESAKSPRADKDVQKWASATDTASTDIRAAAAQIIADSQTSGTNPGALLNAFLTRYIASPFQAGAGTVFDSTGAETTRFESLIHSSLTAGDRIPSDNTACVIDVHAKLGLDELRRSYEKIVSAKVLARSPIVAQERPVPDVAMGIIFAVDSDVPIEAIADEVARLNRANNYLLWPDMVVVLSRGTVNLTCQFPYQGMGDFLPPSRQATYRVAMYVHVFARSHGAFALNKMCAVLFYYLYLFHPELGLPPYLEVLKDMPKTGMPIAAFQFNLKGDLVPVSTLGSFDDLFMFALSFRVEDRKGSLHAKVQYLPWQDGGVVRVQGQFPIEALLVLAGKEAISEPVVRFQGEQTSGVIPMSREQFKEIDGTSIF